MPVNPSPLYPAASRMTCKSSCKGGLVAAMSHCNDGRRDRYGTSKPGLVQEETVEETLVQEM